MKKLGKKGIAPLIALLFNPYFLGALLILILLLVSGITILTWILGLTIYRLIGGLIVGGVILSYILGKPIPAKPAVIALIAGVVIFFLPILSSAMGGHTIGAIFQ